MSNTHVQWAIKILTDRGYIVQNPVPEYIQRNPWSEVCRFATNQGFIYLKKVPPALALESTIIKLLYEQFHANVPVILADNQTEFCFLMLDAGISLHNFFKQEFKADILIDTLKNYTKVQLMASDKINLFISLGVPDWRLEKLPMLYQELINQEDLLISDGLTAKELKKTHSLDSKLHSLCKQLSQYKITESIGHCDFHDKNILIDINTNKTTIIDLGEVAITYPLFSLVNCLNMAKENFALTNSQYEQLQEECLQPWLAIESKKHLSEIVAIMQQCWPIHAVLGEYRLLKAVDPIKLQRQGRFANKLRYWIDQYI